MGPVISSREATADTDRDVDGFIDDLKGSVMMSSSGTARASSPDPVNARSDAQTSTPQSASNTPKKKTKRKKAKKNKRGPQFSHPESSSSHTVNSPLDHSSPFVSSQNPHSAIHTTSESSHFSSSPLQQIAEAEAEAKAETLPSTSSESSHFSSSPLPQIAETETSPPTTRESSHPLTPTHSDPPSEAEYLSFSSSSATLRAASEYLSLDSASREQSPSGEEEPAHTNTPVEEDNIKQSPESQPQDDVSFPVVDQPTDSTPHLQTSSSHDLPLRSGISSRQVQLSPINTQYLPSDSASPEEAHKVRTEAVNLIRDRTRSRQSSASQSSASTSPVEHSRQPSWFARYFASMESETPRKKAEEAQDTSLSTSEAAAAGEASRVPDANPSSTELKRPLTVKEKNAIQKALKAEKAKRHRKNKALAKKQARLGHQQDPDASAGDHLLSPERSSSNVKTSAAQSVMKPEGSVRVPPEAAEPRIISSSHEQTTPPPSAASLPQSKPEPSMQKVKNRNEKEKDRKRRARLVQQEMVPLSDMYDALYASDDKQPQSRASKLGVDPSVQRGPASTSSSRKNIPTKHFDAASSQSKQQTTVTTGDRGIIPSGSTQTKNVHHSSSQQRKTARQQVEQSNTKVQTVPATSGQATHKDIVSRTPRGGVILNIDPLPKTDLRNPGDVSARHSLYEDGSPQKKDRKGKRAEQPRQTLRREDFGKNIPEWTTRVDSSTPAVKAFASEEVPKAKSNVPPQQMIGDIAVPNAPTTKATTVSDSLDVQAKTQQTNVPSPMNIKSDTPATRPASAISSNRSQETKGTSATSRSSVHPVAPASETKTPSPAKISHAHPRAPSTPGGQSLSQSQASSVSSARRQSQFQATHGAATSSSSSMPQEYLDRLNEAHARLPTTGPAPPPAASDPSISNRYERSEYCTRPWKSPTKEWWWNLDSESFTCVKWDCEKQCNLWDGVSTICPRCGPYSYTRYCSKEHLLADVKEHWLVCGQYPFYHLCKDSTIPRSFRSGPPLIPTKHGWDFPERHRQAVHFAMNQSAGDYFIFADWQDCVAAGQPAELAAVRCPTRLLAVVNFEDAERKDRFRRILAACLFASLEHVNLVDYMFRMVRDHLRSKGEWSPMLETSVIYQMKLELSVTIQPWIVRQRHACETEWDGRNPRHCSDRVCRAERPQLLGDVTMGRGFARLLDWLESSYWLLRAARSTHPSVAAVADRVRGVGYVDVVDEDRRLFWRGEGWDGVNTGAMEIEGVNVSVPV